MQFDQVRSHNYNTLNNEMSNKILLFGTFSPSNFDVSVTIRAILFMAKPHCMSYGNIKICKQHLRSWIFYYIKIYERKNRSYIYTRWLPLTRMSLNLFNSQFTTHSLFSNYRTFFNQLLCSVFSLTNFMNNSSNTPTTISQWNILSSSLSANITPASKLSKESTCKAT